jgi:hypothetical protein
VRVGAGGNGPIPGKYDATKNWRVADALWKDKDHKLMNNTVLVREDTSAGPVYGVRLYDTEVVRFYPDGTIELNSGGYRTSTSLRRMNTHSPLHVFQHNRVWYVSDREKFHNPIPWSCLGVKEPDPVVKFKDRIKWHPERGFE